MLAARIALRAGWGRLKVRFIFDLRDARGARGWPDCLSNAVQGSCGKTVRSHPWPSTGSSNATATRELY